MNLRDQLLKAGLAGKKQAQKAANAARKQETENRKKERKGEAAEDDIARDIREKQEAQKLKDQELNRKRAEDKAERERVAQIVDLLHSHDKRISGKNVDVIYYFKLRSDAIDGIPVTEAQQKALARGELGIASGGPIGERYYLIPFEQLLKLEKLDDQLIVCLHPFDETL